MADERLKAWLRQARADWSAAQAEGGSPCHERYWLQQTCEKSLKALGLILWRPRPQDDGHFRQHFLHRHSPLLSLTAAVNDDPSLPASLRLLLRQINAELTRLDGSNVLSRVDATTPTVNPSDVSYRYPFQDTEGKEVAPADWSAADWDAYQGNAGGVIAALDRFLKELENRRIAARTA